MSSSSLTNLALSIFLNDDSKTLVKTVDQTLDSIQLMIVRKLMLLLGYNKIVVRLNIGILHDQGRRKEGEGGGN